VARSDISVVLCGETGVGKEVVAETIHGLSARSARPMVRVNCAALADALVESELFGHERGAFTGAVQAKPGLLEAASGGTFFLDEVGELPLLTQAKLLRVLESRDIIRVGGLTPRPIDVRFIAATNRDLRALCDVRAFRSDLYFRLNGITIRIPPLRERPGDIRPLAEELIARHAERSKRPPPVLTRAAALHLEAHSWPGNVRELRNVVERALVLCGKGKIEPEHLPLDHAGAESAPLDASASGAYKGVPGPTEAPPPSLDADNAGLSLKAHLRALEKERIVAALARCGGNQSKAARVLGMSRKTLVARLDAWQLPRPRK
jgi:transcriptional regulator with PAS, ATPase and Fis domain